MENLKTFGLSELNMIIAERNNVVLTPSWKAVNIRSSFTRIYMVTNGTGWLRFGNTVMKMTPGNVYIVPAGLTFSYDCEDGFSKTYFHISIRMQNGYDVFEGLEKCIEFHDPDAVARITESLDADTVTKIMQIKSYLYSIVFRCMELRDDTVITKYSDYVTEIISYTERNLSANLTVENIAEALFTSPAKIRKSFRTETGISIGKYIDDRIMFEAEFNVRCKSLSIKEISEKLGFCDQFYFSRCFTKKYGISPLRYRKEQMYK